MSDLHKWLLIALPLASFVTILMWGQVAAGRSARAEEEYRAHYGQDTGVVDMGWLSSAFADEPIVMDDPVARQEELLAQDKEKFQQWREQERAAWDEMTGSFERDMRIYGGE